MFSSIDIDYKVGDRIRHTDYGEGTITEVDKKIITVLFDTSTTGPKKFIKNHKSITPA